MTQADPGRRQAVVEVLARHRARQRIRPGEDWGTVLAGCLAEVDASPEPDAIIAEVDATAPPPQDWDPEVRRAIRRLWRQPGRKPSDGL
jgi:hypothetical protein